MQISIIILVDVNNNAGNKHTTETQSLKFQSTFAGYKLFAC